jgi:hypothetical protein
MHTAHHHDHEQLRGVLDADLVALGLGGTSMMSMLWTVAMGRRAVGVEMRGDPFLGVHWNIREDLYHQLGLIDQMMLDRYGEERLPRRGDGRIFRLAECLYSTDTVAGDIVADEIIDGYDRHQHIVGTIHHVEFIDDRWRDGLPNRVVTLLQPPPPPPGPDPARIRRSVREVLDGPSTFQAGAASVLVLLRRYLERIEQQDLEAGCEHPRVRLFTRHRVIPTEGDGFLPQPDGRLAIRIEALQELDFRGRFVRVRAPGSEPIDLGVPELFMVAEGFSGSDAVRLGFAQRDVAVDHGDGRGPVVAQADFLAGLIEALVGGRLRRRISTAHDADGKEYWIRQIAVGHEDDPEVGWVLVQVPDFMTFDPVEADLVAPDTDPDSPEFFAAYQHLLYDYYIEQAAEILELPAAELKKVQMVYGPKLFSLVERVGADAQIAANGVVAGDSFGNGHFLTSGGAMTGMVGHSARVLRYWQEREEGTTPPAALRTLAEAIARDTEDWLEVSAQEYSEALPINFGAERIEQINATSGTDPLLRAAAIDATRRKRHSLLPLDPSDWRRLFLRNGKVLSAPLPELHAMHPALRGQRPRGGAKPVVVYVTRSVGPETGSCLNALAGQPGVRVIVLSEAAPDVLPERLRRRLAGHARVDSCADPGEVSTVINELAVELGRPAVLLGAEDDVQLALVAVSEALGLRGRATAATPLDDRPALLDRLRREGLPVAEPPGDDALDVELTQAVMSVGGVPAWSAATRGGGAVSAAGDPARPRVVWLPREPDEAAEATIRRMGLAALRALGIGAGMATVEWVRRADGTMAISSVADRPPVAPIVSVLGQAHAADLYAAWANAVVHGLFAPIPRQFAAGAVILGGRRPGQGVLAVHGWEEASQALGDLVVEARLPEAGRPAGRPDGEAFVVLRHPETGVVDRSLRELRSALTVELG